MNYKKFLLYFTAGYFASAIMMYLVFGRFSWSFVVGSVLGIGLFGLVMWTLRKNKRQERR